MSTRFKNTLYTIEDFKCVGGHLRYVTNEDGTLFSGHYRTKIKPEDLPEWYLHGLLLQAVGIYVYQRHHRPGVSTQSIQQPLPER